MNVRLLPLLVISATALLVLKLLGLTFGTETAVLQIREAVAQEAGQAVPEDGAGGDPAAAGEAADAQADPAPPPVPESLEIGGSAAERAVLESLGERRRNLEQQEGQLDLRERLLQATEERIQKRVDELKALEQRIEAAVEEKRVQEENEIAGLVQMYENMKPKDAARIFNSLDLDVLLKIVRQMKPRKMADILGRMSPEAAERLTVAIASSNNQPARADAPAAQDLPKIQAN
ncbi:hypothetical protein GCM10011316_06930 [Roseibium aquae]|uniref:Flagellar motility protein MotE (MotC chaperone) n=1 Tax=Roseibium aquae TaxID=1323746 RepID=A0A916TA22_9HYPH|nr:hypothetical protein [Roseibium aquae]GGB37416.1 hypothetical protein GCM10011316_06930 [Roseibium aquae]